MKVNLNLPFLNNNNISSRLFGSQQSKPQQGAAVSADRQDKTQFGKKTKATSPLDLLSQRKEEVLQKKRELIKETLSSGENITKIKDQLDFYDEQVDTIEQQMSSLIAQQAQKQAEQIKEAAEEMSEKNKSQSTEGEVVGIEAKQMTDVISSLDSIEKAEIEASVVDKLEGRLKELTANRKMDGGNSNDSLMNEISALQEKITVTKVESAKRVQQTAEEISEKATEEAAAEETSETEEAGAEQTVVEEIMIAKENKEE